MLSLIGKDLVAARWFLLAALPVYAAQLASLGASPPAAMIVVLMFTSLFAFGSIGIEEAQGTDVTWCSLPVDRHQIVLARYLTTTLGVLVGLGMSWAISRGELGLPAQAAAFFVLLTVASLFLPCYFRFGAGRGLMFFAVLSLGLIVLLASVGSLIVFLTDSANLPDGSDEERIAAAEAWIESAAPFLAGLLILTALLGLSASAALSIRLFRARDL